MAGRSNLILALALLAASPAAAEETVRFPSLDADVTQGAPTELAALLFRPAGPGPHPAVVMLHGCGGMWTGSGKLGSRDRDWAERFAAAGFVVLEVDSLTPRGLRSICKATDVKISPGRERARDAHAALAWLRNQPWVRRDRIALIGWSNGGSTVLSTIDRRAPARPEADADFRLAIAFYPGCRTSARSERWRARLPLTILIGEADDWTSAAPCRDLAARAAEQRRPFDLVVYPGALHDFDAPNMAVHTMNGLSTESGVAHLGTDPAARADAIRRVMALLAPLTEN